MARAFNTPPASRREARREALRDGLPLTVELLKNRLACDIPVGYVEDYVALDWLEWHGGTLRLTATGQNVCRYATSMQHKRQA
ncbi:hypothetical protein [Azohydromonas lata]|uniref:Uncharacterized protein n=1 Tax=Azohydromonas lata TaxID=45677 RepID=A0ABU5IAI4_9BURK|nr:hypothetical protein [Azohydromonas lata]MDZ5456119.1 hypothetical protein [Azohydromonas lata]